MEQLRQKKGFIIDMDGVIYHGNRLLPRRQGVCGMALPGRTSNFCSSPTPAGAPPVELQKKLGWMGLDVDESHFYTSAQATASFIASQYPEASAYAVGEHGLLNALYDAGITVNEIDPDYVIIGEADNYNYDSIIKAVQFVNQGAKLIGTNSDLTGPKGDGIAPACRALMAPIELVTGKSAYFVGKPNPLMMRTGLKLLGVHSEETAIVGDRMDTDIVAGIETGLDTALVLTGVTTRETIGDFPYRPRLVLENVGEIAKD